MNKLSIFKKEIKKDWYIQGFSAFPIFLNPAAHSGLVMKDELGFGYEEFIFSYRNEFGEMWYLDDDFSRIWKITKKKLKTDPKYLKKVKKRYEELFNYNEKLFSRIDSARLPSLADAEALELLKGCSRSTTDGVGIAHILDPIGPKIETEFKAELTKCISNNKEFNDVFSILTTPEELSFIAQEEEALRCIARSGRSVRQKKLERHAKKYFWVQNSFAGGKNLTLSFFEKRIPAIAKRKPIKKIMQADKRKLITKYKLNSNIQKMVELINFSAIWQDQRKANVLRSVGYFEKVLSELSRRTKINRDLLHYLGFTDILNADSLKDIIKLKKELASRKKGMFVLMRYKQEHNAFGSEYVELTKYREKLSEAKEKDNSKELHGSITSQGTAIGKVVICIGIRSFSKVKKGDIVVASMTRPEYMPALKKAAAIITDEGGITSHAAIIARELGIPAVIGTKVATKILKDGDLVEVRANHGVVKILKRK